MFCPADGAPLVATDEPATVVAPLPTAVDSPSQRPPPLPPLPRLAPADAAHITLAGTSAAPSPAGARGSDAGRDARSPATTRGPGAAKASPKPAAKPVVAARPVTATDANPGGGNTDRSAAAPFRAHAKPASSLQRVERNNTIHHANPPATLENKATFVSSSDGIDEPPDEEEEQSPYIGKLIDERYLVQSLIGRGGMGSVYRTEQVHLRKTMAIKLLHENLGSRKQLISRFTREARAISRLSSQHTVRVFDFGRWGEVFYLVMELLEGEALDALLEREGPLPAERTVKIALQMCDSLEEAHKHGIVHRDLKPENVMLLRDAAHPDFVKILDFGLAKVQGVDDPYTIHSQRDIFGTPYYMSPEQIRATTEVDHRADIYAVGALLFRILTNKHVFGAERNTFDILKAHLMEPPPKMVDVAPEAKVPAGLEQVVGKALEKDPARRFQSMNEFAAALVAAQKNGFVDTSLADRAVGVVAPPPGPDDPTGRPSPAAKTTAGTAAPPALRKAPAASESSQAELAENDEVLRKDAVRGQRLRVVGFFAAIVLGLGVLAVALVVDPANGGGSEAEPNDAPDQANRLDADGGATGVIGRRRGATLGDQDCYLLPAVRDSDQLTVRLTGVPNMDLAVSLHDAGGAARVTQSHRGRGQGELLRFVDGRVAPTTLCVAEHLEGGAVPGESLSDAYTLHVQVAPRPPQVEREPNDQGQGNELAAGTALQGSLDGPGDRDLFALQGNVENRVVRISLDLQQTQAATGGARMALLDSAQRMVASIVLRPGELRSVLAFVATNRQIPDRLVLQRLSTAPAAEAEVGYSVRFDHADLGDQAEVEPNNTVESATPMVLGAWHVGNADDAAGVDWLRIDGGDPSMQRIRIETLAPAGSSAWLVVRDQGTQVDLRKLQLVGGSQEQELLVSGSGAGFLIKLQQLAPGSSRRGRDPESRYQIRARYLSPEDDAGRAAQP